MIGLLKQVSAPRSQPVSVPCFSPVAAPVRAEPTRTLAGKTPLLANRGEIAIRSEAGIE
jgi:hypothetical protein